MKAYMKKKNNAKRIQKIVKKKMSRDLGQLFFSQRAKRK